LLPPRDTDKRRAVVAGPQGWRPALGGGASAVAFFMAVPAFQLVQTMGNVLWLAAVGLWLFLLLKTWQGETWRVPVAGDLAKKLAGR